MKRIVNTIVIIAMFLCIGIIQTYAQNNLADYLKAIEKALSEKDCDHAKKVYDWYKLDGGPPDRELENRIANCGKPVVNGGSASPGQDMTSLYKQQAEEFLEQMDYNNAQKMYNTYKESGGRADINFEARIKNCKNFVYYKELIQSTMTSNPTISFENGAKYKGETYDGKRNGLGAYYYDCTCLFIGEWKAGEKTGNGIYVVHDLNRILSNCPDCMYHYGSREKDELSGKGTCYDNTGKLIYYGDFKDGKPTGVYPSTGNFSSYKFELIDLSDNALYVGETKDGKRHGAGIHFWQNGDIWYGSWTDGSRDGYGIYIYKNGTMFTGTWKGDTYTK